MLHGQNPNSAILLSMLGIDQEGSKYSSGRFRDIYLNADGTKILLYTRNGGGNREDYQQVFDELETHPNYVKDYDDDFDCTYATIEFTVPAEHASMAAKMADGKNPKTIHEKFEESMKEMQSMTREQIEADPRFAPLCAIMKQIADPSNEQKVFTV